MAVQKGLKPETIRVTVWRKNLWQDYVNSINSHYTPGHTIKITFCGEPAIDDGGPRREFFSGKTGITVAQWFSTFFAPGPTWVILIETATHLPRATHLSPPHR